MTKNLLNWLYALFSAIGATIWSAALYIKGGPAPLIVMGLFIVLTAYCLSRTEVPSE